MPGLPFTVGGVAVLATLWIAATLPASATVAVECLNEEDVEGEDGIHKSNKGRAKV